MPLLRKKQSVIIFIALLLSTSVALFILTYCDERTGLGLRYDSTGDAAHIFTDQHVTTIAANIPVSTAGVEKRSEQTQPDTPAKTFMDVSRVIPTRTKSDSTEECNWVNFTGRSPPYFLTAVFIVRVYEKDLSELTTAEIKQWLVYLQYAGVQHVYLYDLWYLPGEAQREPLDVFIREGYLTYIDRHGLNPFVYQTSQVPCYQQCIDVFGRDSVWQTAIDIDEYPFSPEDTSPGFLSRFVDMYSTENPSVSEITMQNFLYLGEKDKSKEFLIDQLWRHTHGPANALVKPIYKPVDISRAQVHHNVKARGQTRDAPSSSLRMNHYWGARLQNWGPDTEESLAKTEEDRRMEPILAAFQTCEKQIRPYL